MARLRVHNIGTSIDGFSAGPNQSLEHPLGVRGRELHGWMFATRYGKEMFGEDDAATTPVTVDDLILRRGDEGIGAHILGRNMFGPVRDGWDTWDGEWNGWWGPEPPYHHHVFVLTHHPRPPLEMEGGTTFHFVTDGIESALEQAFAAADGADVRIGGGASTIRQYLRAGLVDHFHFAVAPVLLGSGERVFEGLDGALDAYAVTEVVASPAATHVFLDRKP